MSLRQNFIGESGHRAFMAQYSLRSNLRWRFKHLSSSNSNVPSSPGVYAIGHTNSFHGLELERIYVYVGESQNLRRRLNEHLPDTERNPELQKYLKRNYSVVNLWYAPTDSKEVKRIQDELIFELKPQFNTDGI